MKYLINVAFITKKNVVLIFKKEKFKLINKIWLNHKEKTQV